MNIIKLRDKMMSNDVPYSSYFNKHLKGKYAYWVQMRYIVSFDHMRHEGYVACEEDITKLLPCGDVYPKPYGAPCIDVYDPYILPYIDSVETDRVNNIIEFRIKNKYVTDEDITIDEVKQFRTWLASELLKMDQTESGDQKSILFSSIEEHILKYYAEGAYDNTIKVLTEFGQTTASYSMIEKDCGCNSSSNISSLYNSTPSTCDPISIYRKNIHAKMVEMFSNIDFWIRYPMEFLGVFKKYVDNIIKLNLPINHDNYDRYSECSCEDTNSNNSINILKRLSESLDYMMTNNIHGHKNYIYDALHEWSSKLYENMIW